MKNAFIKIIILFFLIISSSYAEIKNILIVTDLVITEHRAVMELNEIYDKLDKNYSIIIFVVNFLNRDGFTKQELIEFIQVKRINFELVIALGQPAADLLSLHRNDIFSSDLPIIYISENVQQIKDPRGHLVEINFDYDRNLVLAKTLCNHTAIVYDNSESGLIEKNTPDVTYVKFKNKEFLSDTLNKLTNDFDKICILFKSAILPESGIGFSSARQAIDFIRMVINDPIILVMRDNIVEEIGVLGGYVITSKNYSSAIQEELNTIKSPPSLIKIKMIQEQPMFNYETVEKLKAVRYFEVPFGSVLINDPFETFKKNRALIELFVFILLVSIIILEISFYFIRKNRININNK